MIKPAEAEAEKVKILAMADAERTRIAAEAAASNNRVALDQLLIAQLPQIVKEAAVGLNGANVSVLNGADGLGEIAAGLVSQGLTILESVRGRRASGDGVPPTPSTAAPRSATSPATRIGRPATGSGRRRSPDGRPSQGRSAAPDWRAARWEGSERAWISSMRWTTRGSSRGRGYSRSGAARFPVAGSGHGRRMRG